MNAAATIAIALRPWLSKPERNRLRIALFRPAPAPKSHEPALFLRLAGSLVCGGPAIGFLLASSISLPEGPSVGAGVLLAIFGPFAALIWGIVDERKRMRSGPPGEALPPGVVGKAADGLYVYREGSLEALGRNARRGEA